MSDQVHALILTMYGDPRLHRISLTISVDADSVETFQTTPIPDFCSLTWSYTHKNGHKMGRM